MGAGGWRGWAGVERRFGRGGGMGFMRCRADDERTYANTQQLKFRHESKLGLMVFFLFFFLRW